MNWEKYFAEDDERKRWDMIIAKSYDPISYDTIPTDSPLMMHAVVADAWLHDLKRWMIEEIMNWCYKNNTIPFQDSNIQLCSTDGGWINVLKLKKFLEERK